AKAGKRHEIIPKQETARRSGGVGMIRVVDLEKSYSGKRVLGPVGFEVKQGETLGILGRNGAGKTTLLRILAGDLKPSAGQVWIDGVDALREPARARVRIGYLPEAPP